MNIIKENLNTIIVPSTIKGFEEVFLKKNCWYAIRLSTNRLKDIKYIALYQLAPISAITHYAEVDKIEKYEDTDKYIINFKNKPERIGPIKFQREERNIIIRAVRYTSIEKLKHAKKLSQVF